MVYISKPEFEMDPWNGEVNAEVKLNFTLDDARALYGCMSPDSTSHVIVNAVRNALYRGMFNTHYIGTTYWGKRANTPKIERVILHDPATIVYWMDGTKTVVKAHNEKFDKEKVLLAAIAKKVYGNKGSFNNVIKHFVEEWLMEDYPVVDKTFLCGIEDDKKTIAESPISFIFTIGPENKDAFIDCYRKVKPMDNMQDMMNAALGLYLAKIYSDKYTTE